MGLAPKYLFEPVKEAHELFEDHGPGFGEPNFHVRALKPGRTPDQALFLKIILN